MWPHCGNWYMQYMQRTWTLTCLLMTAIMGRMAECNWIGFLITIHLISVWSDSDLQDILMPYVVMHFTHLNGQLIQDFNNKLDAKHIWLELSLLKICFIFLVELPTRNVYFIDTPRKIWVWFRLIKHLWNMAHTRGKLSSSERITWPRHNNGQRTMCISYVILWTFL